ncbi:hypothetical protein AAGP72_25270, partial [Klebsiella pneumoniae]
LMMSLWDALRMNMMISYQELVRTFLSFMRAVRSLDKHEYDFLGFYAGGASHKIIGQFLGRENGSSRNKSSQILKKLNIGNRDDAFIVIHLSDLMEPIMKNVRDIIARNVNKLL